jgi:flagellar protein FliO/FliZ
MGFGTFLSSILALALALAFVLGLAWAFIWLMRKWQDHQTGAIGDGANDRPIRFLRSLPLGQRERVTMISAHGEVMLLGVSAGAITLLARWPEEISDKSEETENDLSIAEKPQRRFSLPDFPSIPTRKN